MPKVCNLCISPVWLSHHKIVMMLQKQHIPFWNGDQIAILCTFLSQNDLRTLFVAKNHLRTFFVAKTIYTLRLESFCALNFAIRKVQTFWASARTSQILFNEEDSSLFVRLILMACLFESSWFLACFLVSSQNLDLDYASPHRQTPLPIGWFRR